MNRFKWRYIWAAIILIGALYSWIVINNTLIEGHATSLASNGRNILVLLYAFDGEDNLAPPNFYPKSSGEHSFSSSTEFFKSFVSSNKLNIQYSLFAGPNVSPAFTGEFKSVNNAWSIVADLTNGMPADTPILISKNVYLESLNDKPIIIDANILGDNLGVVVLMSGAALVLDVDAIYELLNNLSLSNNVLRP